MLWFPGGNWLEMCGFWWYFNFWILGRKGLSRSVMARSLVFMPKSLFLQGQLQILDCSKNGSFFLAKSTSSICFLIDQSTSSICLNDFESFWISIFTIVASENLHLQLWISPPGCSCGSLDFPSRHPGEPQPTNCHPHQSACHFQMECQICNVSYFLPNARPVEIWPLYHMQDIFYQVECQNVWQM